MKYRTKNWKTYNAALKARGALTLWLAKPISATRSTSRRQPCQVNLAFLWLFTRSTPSVNPEALQLQSPRPGRVNNLLRHHT